MGESGSMAWKKGGSGLLYLLTEPEGEDELDMVYVVYVVVGRQRLV